jgi:hypothetical protein
VANAENFMLLPIITGFLLILKFQEKKRFLVFFLSGVVFALAALFKVPAGFDFAAALVFIFIITEKKLFAIRDTLYAIFGFLLPFFITFAYFFWQNAWREYFIAAFSQNLPYLSSWTGGQTLSGGLPIALLIRAGLVGLVILLIIFWRRKISLAAKLILLWFSFSLFAALLSSRPYPHYLLQVIPSLSLSAGLVFKKSKEKIIPLLLVCIFVFSFLFFHFWHYPNLSYYLNFYQFALGKKNKEEYFSFFGDHAKTLYEIADYVQQHTQPEEKIFIWGTQPSIYALSRRLPVGRYTVSYHIIDFNGYQETMMALKEKSPKLIIKLEEEKRPFSQLEAFLKTDYLVVKEFSGAEIYLRVK